MHTNISLTCTCHPYTHIADIHAPNAHISICNKLSSLNKGKTNFGSKYYSVKYILLNLSSCPGSSFFSTHFHELPLVLLWLQILSPISTLCLPSKFWPDISQCTGLFHLTFPQTQLKLTNSLDFVYFCPNPAPPTKPLI